MTLCVACGSVVLQSTNRRRLSNANVLPVLKELVLQFYDLQQFGLNTDGAVACRGCFAKLEKVKKLRREEISLRKQLTSGIQRAGDHLGLQATVQDDSTLPSTSAVGDPSALPSTSASSATATTPKRSAPESLTVVEFSGSSPKRRKTSTPSVPASECAGVTSTPKRKKRLYGTPERQAFGRIGEARTPNVSVLVKKNQNARVFPLTRSLKRLGRSVGRCNRGSIARQVVNDDKICQKIVKLLGKKIEREMKTMCKLSTNSVLRRRDPEGFNLDSVITEMKKCAPNTLSLLRNCLSGHRRSEATEMRTRGRTKSRIFGVDKVVSVCCAILLRGRSQRMNGLQRIVSMILYCGHASKRVYTRLQKLLFCLSHKSTIAYTNTLGQGHDAEVLSWRNAILRGPSATCDANPVDNCTTVLEHNSVGGSPSDAESTVTGSVSPPDFSPVSSVCSSPAEESTNSESAASLSDILGTSSSAAPTSSSLPTFKAVGDNLDMNLKPRDVRIDSQTKSIHYYHYYCLRDRIDLTGVPDSFSLPDIADIDFQGLLPGVEDESAMRGNFNYLVARVLCKTMPFFKKYGNGLERHKLHQYSTEMSRKSEVVPLGIIPKSEVSHEGMIDIMDEIHQYVPTWTSTKEVERPESSEKVEVTVDEFHHILMGGDQLTVARSRGSKRVRGNSVRARDRLEGIIPVCEDWHSKGCFITAMWKQFFNTASGCDGGTLYQLRNLINRRNVVKKPMDDLAASEDFIVTVVEAHILTAAMTLFGMKNLQDRPCEELFPVESEDLDSLQRRNILMLATKQLVDTFVDISVPQLEPTNTPHSPASAQMEPTNTPHSPASAQVDSKFAYACDLLGNGLLLMEFIDGVREGDGNRIVRVWRYMLLIFKATKCKNYAIESFTLLMQQAYLFSPRLAAQLVWNRTVNVHGRIGRNISADLFMEHLNRECKDILAGMYSNISEQSMLRVSRALKPLQSAMLAFDIQNEVPLDSGSHTRKSSSADMEKLVKQLFEISNVFTMSAESRTHKNFPQHSSNIMLKLDSTKLKKWMKEKAEDIIVYHQ